MLQHLTIATVLDIAAKADAKRTAESQHERERRAAKGITVLGFGNLPTLEDMFGADALPAVKATKDAVDALSREERQELAALMWLGRGDQVNWESALNHAATVIGNPEPGYLTSKIDLGPWLRAGLAKLGL